MPRPEPQCCALGSCCHEVASDWTVHQAWRVLRGALTQAMREELVFRNVAALVRVPMPRPRRQAVWTVDEARRFLESARSDNDPMYAGYVLLLTLGLRRGEMLGLAWEDVDLELGEALIAWQVQRVDHSLQRRHTKTSSSDAPLPLPEIAVRALERHRVEEARRRLAAGDMWGDSGPVFTTRLGDPVDPRNFHRDFKLRAAKAGVPVVPIHSIGGPVPTYSWSSTSTRASRWPCFDTAESHSRWRSTRRSRRRPHAMHSSAWAVSLTVVSGSALSLRWDFPLMPYIRRYGGTRR